MKLFIIATIALVGVSRQKCNKEKFTVNCFKGRLEIKGICSNYTIKLLQGNIDTSKIAATWKDDVTQKTYNNVFALGSPCSFPSSINAGDEFYFALSDEVQNCAVCLAYYPHPSKAVSIKVLDKTCN
ncbi:MAG: hypothetical protein M3Y85_10490 [Bacteroidota bacterium]|nr:hypothetical protein [Bacteroidota bacterium]